MKGLAENGWDSAVLLVPFQAWVLRQCRYKKRILLLCIHPCLLRRRWAFNCNRLDSIYVSVGCPWWLHQWECTPIAPSSHLYSCSGFNNSCLPLSSWCYIWGLNLSIRNNYVLTHLLPCFTSEDSSSNNSVGEFMVIFGSKSGNKVNLMTEMLTLTVHSVYVEHVNPIWWGRSPSSWGGGCRKQWRQYW